MTLAVKVCVCVCVHIFSSRDTLMTAKIMPQVSRQVPCRLLPLLSLA